ncbi:lysis system i-spanin subunit Rz [Stenotrophomonas maltophilia]|uniref:lysis system i-spanin subunit Rz n=1 Tax=Stenotrophomonas maltophilia TaxID=40324 RepID=UPI0021CA721A|nr:lysis system i-spanin subunit Rz [Stenotrophomonas maltophilia]MCU1021472.1 lysis protein [Stenotrophomonas maltophilia]HEL3863049.1 lysis protein [Stenotrophomonas maltophilia]HEL4287425.1 lysis protein [Stenotrophomonas maltophilia]
MNRIAIAVAAFALWSLAMVGVGWAWRGDRAEGSDANQRAAGAEAVADQVNQTRAVEHSQADSLATIGAKHEEDRAAAEAVPAAVVADLRNGNLRLRDDLATCHTARLSEAAAGAVKRDARAELRPEVVGAVVRIVTDAEDHVRACQEVINVR